jgi:hypothetical protein
MPPATRTPAAAAIPTIGRTIVNSFLCSWSGLINQLLAQIHCIGRR